MLPFFLGSFEAPVDLSNFGKTFWKFRFFEAAFEGSECEVWEDFSGGLRQVSVHFYHEGGILTAFSATDGGRL